MQKNKKEKMPQRFNSYLVDVNVSMLIPSVKNKKEAVNLAIKSLKEYKYIIGKNFISTRIYD